MEGGKQFESLRAISNDKVFDTSVGRKAADRTNMDVT